jgi:hypothetical protein
VNHDLPDGYVSPGKLININSIVNNIHTVEKNWIAAFRCDSALQWDSNGNYKLLPGENKLGGHGHVLSNPPANIPITWQGTKFSGTLTTTGNSSFNYSLEGSVSPDGTTLVCRKLYITQPSTLEPGNIPLNDRNYFMGQGPDLKKFVTKFEAFMGVELKQTLAWSLNNVNWDKSMINIGFE